MRVVIDSDTENITDAEEIYAGGNPGVPKPDRSKKSMPFLRSPTVELNHKMAWTPTYSVLDEVVPTDFDVVGKRVAYDEGASRGWGSVGPKFMEAARVTGEELINPGNSKAAIAAGALNAGISILDAAMGADKADVLGLFGFLGTTPSEHPHAHPSSRRRYKTRGWVARHDVPPHRD